MATIPNHQMINAATNGDLPTIKLWRQQNPHASIDMARNSRNCNALHVACQHGRLEVVKYLVESCQANVNLQNRDTWTPLHLACQCGSLEIVKYLIALPQVNANLQDNSRYTALHHACSCNNLELVKCLVESRKVDITIENNQQKTPFQHARYHGYSQVSTYVATCFQTVFLQGGRTPCNSKRLIQKGHNNINQDRLQALREAKHTDITFLVGRDGDQASIKANSTILLATVPSIATLLDGGINDQTVPASTSAPTPIVIPTSAPSAETAGERTILLPECKPTHVQCALRYIYAGDVSFLDTPAMAEQDNLQQLVIVANHFHCWKLKLIVEAELIHNHLAQETLIDLLLFAHQHGCIVLKDEAVRMAAADAVTLLNHVCFGKLAEHPDVMKEIHIHHRGGTAQGGTDDKYDKMSMLALYQLLEECEDTALETYMQRASLSKFVRSAMLEAAEKKQNVV